MVIKILTFGMFVSLILTILIEPIIIPYMRKLKFGQSIRQDGPQSHLSKSGTPTMGGTVFSLVTLITVAAYFLIYNLGQDFNIKTWILLFVPLIGYGTIGFIDDYLIVVRKSNIGLKPKYKFIGQIVIAGIFFFLYLIEGFSTELFITQNFSIDLKWFYGILIFFMLVGGSNAVNLTDGLDGLASGLATFAIATYTFIAFMNNQLDVFLFGVALLGTVLGFLVFNSHPAKIFMGDTGSLALGAALASMAILTKQELLLILVGGVFVLETLSVILQVFYFKKTHGKRIFRMAPLHHHFELGGMKESSVVLMFYVVGFILSLLAIGIVLY
ncbi:MAG: Phospho-N-acetylmuramoyl-pentapeptide transferase [Haloplasmataceae bacterium]|jgi:phospho-N-acetylmuramoyl-pentapeptide-transferase|nr:Phospho-N-acetylmuramoyl-pentapeptide transferase [Haloplasmataceae bacterium]